MVFFILDESMFDSDNENPPPSWTPPQESSLEDTRVSADAEQVPGFSEITYQLVQEGTIRGKTKLVTNTGYSYSIRKRRPNGTIDWQCTVRRKDFRCKASVIQRDGKFFEGRQHHSHPGAIGTITAAEITARVKQIAREEIFRPTSAIVNEVTTLSLRSWYHLESLLCTMCVGYDRPMRLLCSTVTFTVLPRQTCLYEFNLFYIRSREIL